MKVYGTASIADLLGDFVAYRSLRPADARLPGLAELAPGPPPRKGAPEYARVAAAILRAARQLTAPGVPLERLVFIGDTRLSDGGAFTTLRDVTGWQSRCFIGRDDAAPPAVEQEGDITFANRWSALPAFADRLDAEGFAVDERAAVVIDIDKTLLGGRGRNDKLIDRARLRALRDAVRDVVGDSFDEQRFAEIYRAIDQPRFHPLTADNQDYVGYLCIIVAGSVLRLEHLEELLARPQPPGPERLLAEVAEACEAVGWPSAGVRVFHERFAAQAAAGDPTPFKAFRRREFAETAALMGRLGEGAAAEVALAEELVLTGEVWAVAERWRAAGALLFGLSDKPDEAAVPTEQDAVRGALPIHRIRTRIVGE
ncbi:MAG: hypothetical protein DIU80_021915 [Chloroflexota bacterium]